MPGGGTVILPAIEEAFYALQNVQTRYKHVLVLTDGGVESGDFESLMRRMSARGINVSTVLVGGDAHSEFLVNLANWGKGHFYAASQPIQHPGSSAQATIDLQDPAPTVRARTLSAWPVRQPGGERSRGRRIRS